MAEEKEKPRPVLSLDDLQLEDDSIVIDPNADAFAMPAPPHDGQHLCKITLFETGGTAFQAGKDKNGRSYVMAHVQLEIVDETDSSNGMKFFDRLSTLVMQSTQTSRVAGLLAALGVQVPARTGHKELAKMLEHELQQEPLVGAQTQWQGRIQLDDNTWKTILRGEKKFPPRKNPETGEPIPGMYIAEVENPNGGDATVGATVLRYLPKDKVRHE